MGLPKLYVVKSDRSGVKKPFERQVVNIIENVAFLGVERTPIDKYILEDGYPYEIFLRRGETSSTDEGHGTGIGDLWSWTYYCSLSLEEAEEYYKKETKRIKEKYNN